MKARTILMLLLVLTSGAFTASAQKIAHINSQELMAKMPAVDSAQKRINKIASHYQSTLEGIEQEMQNKLVFWEENPTDDQDILAIRQSEYEDLQKRYYETQQKAETMIAQKQQELLEPIIKELKEKIETLAKQKGFDYVFDSSDGGGMIYGNPSYDLMADMLKVLGIPAE